MPDSERVRAAAQRYGDASEQIGEPIAVLDHTRSLASWFVPVVEDDVLIGLIELLPDLTLRRTSSFRRRSGSNKGCPPAESWLDATVVRQRAASFGDDVDAHIVGEPYLSFDGVLDRLAWAVPATVAGTERTIFVAGESAWLSNPSAGGGGGGRLSFGGP